MEKLVTWVRTHRWETVSIGLGLSLVVLAVLLVVVAGDRDSVEEGDEGASPTTVAGDDSDEVFPPDVTTTTSGAGSPVVSGSGPFGGDTPIPVTAVVVDNVAGVGFQIGIDQAQLLIEVPVEGGITRYTAFYGETVPVLIGPVRSLRPVSADLLALFTPVVFTTGGQPFVTGMVEGAGSTIVTRDGSIAFQTLERPQPHHVFVTPEVDGALSEPAEAPWDYGEWGGGEPATEVSIQFGGGVSWRFEDGAYVRYVSDERVEVLPRFDSDPVPLTRDTLILMVVNQKSAGYTDSSGAEVPTFDVIGSGVLYLLYQGEVIEGRWFRSGQDSGYRFVTDGGPLPVPTGTVYQAIVPDRTEIEFSG